MIQSILNSVDNLFGGAQRVKQAHIWPSIDYHPLHGIPGKVDKPSYLLNTHFTSPVKGLELLNGPLRSRYRRHPVGTPAYIVAWRQRKARSYHNLDAFTTQLSPYRNRPFRGNRMQTLNGLTVSSRDQNNYVLQPDIAYGNIVSFQKHSFSQHKKMNNPVLRSS